MANKFILVFCVILAGSVTAAQAGFLDELKKGIGNAGGAEGEKNAGDGDAAKGASGNLSTNQVSGGLKEALRVGTERVVGQLGAQDGFLADPEVRIPLPKSLKRVRSALKMAGMEGTMDDLEVRLNRAAEAAVPQAQTLFVNAISEMTIQDAMDIYNGGDDSATRYFQKKMTPELTSAMQPIVNDSLADVGALALYDQAIGEYKDLPFVPDVRTDLTGYVVEKGLDGVFYYLAQEEAAIRNNPLARSTDLLKTVFGN